MNTTYKHRLERSAALNEVFVLKNQEFKEYTESTFLAVPQNYFIAYGHKDTHSLKIKKGHAEQGKYSVSVYSLMFLYIHLSTTLKGYKNEGA